MSKFESILPGSLLNLTPDLIKICEEIYLVGGSVRNYLLNKKIQDYDFVVKKNSIKAAKLIADKLNGDFYILDHKRQTSRNLITIDAEKVKLDFALFNGDSIYADLKSRDFTINAMALKLPIADQILDPAGGQDDLYKKYLRLCKPTALEDDPVRTIRAIRFSEELNLEIHNETQKLIKKAAANLERISPERKRDSLLEVIRTADIKSAFNQMLRLEIFVQLFPDVEKLTNIALTLPHTYNAWDHTMQVAHYCQQIMSELDLAPKKTETHCRIAQAIKRLEPFRNRLIDLFDQEIVFSRSQYQLQIISSLFHDAAKAIVPAIYAGERKKFPDHARVGAELVENWAMHMGFSNKEKALMRNTVRYHMRPSRSPYRDPQRKDVAIHRLFKKADIAGNHVAILHLADVLTTYEDALTDERWEEALIAVENIFDAFFNRYDVVIKPPRLLTGNEILDAMHLKQGKQIGKLVDALTEAQVSGVIHNREEALSYLQDLILSSKNSAERKI